jgi:hypothetical protein
MTSNQDGKTLSQRARNTAGELYGTVCVARQVKEDGRALILYTHTMDIRDDGQETEEQEDEEKETEEQEEQETEEQKQEEQKQEEHNDDDGSTDSDGGDGDHENAAAERTEAASIEDTADKAERR